MKKIIIIIAVGFVILFFIGVVTALFTGEGQKSFEQGKQDAKELVEGQTQEESQVAYTIEAKAEVDSNRITVSGNSNLPNGAILDVTAQRMVVLKNETEEVASLKGMGVEKASVFDGAFTTTVSPLDGDFRAWLDAVGDEVTSVGTNVVITVRFDPKRSQPSQKDEVLATVGENQPQSETSVRFPFTR